MVLLLLAFAFFLVFPVLSISLSVIGLVNDKKRSKIYLLLISFAISIIALRYIPHPTDDGAFHFRATTALIRYDSIFEMFKAFSNGWRVGNYDYGSIPIFTSLMYFVRNTHHYSLLSFISAFITYFSFGYVVVDLFKDLGKFSKLSYATVFIAVLCLNNYRYTTSGMRFCMAVALMMLLLYLESKKGYTSLKTTIWYLLPLGIHSAVIYFIGLRFLFPLIRKVTLAKSLFVLLGFPVLFNLVPWLANLIGWTYLQFFIRKIEVYSDNSSYSQFFNTTLTMRLYVGIVLMVLFVLLYLGIVNSLKITDDWRFSFVTMTYYVTLLSMSSIPFRNIYDRNLFLLLPMIVVSTYILFTYRRQLKILTNRNIVYGLTIGILCLSCAVGVFYNNNFPFGFIDFSQTDLLIKNIFQFFSNLPFT